MGGKGQQTSDAEKCQIYLALCLWLVSAVVRAPRQDARDATRYRVQSAALVQETMCTTESFSRLHSLRAVFEEPGWSPSRRSSRSRPATEPWYSAR